MKFSCTKENLERATAIAERFTGKNVTLPILGNLLLDSDGNTLKVSATNLEYAVEMSLPGKGGRPGRVSIPAKIINSLLQSIKEEKIDLEEKQGNLHIKTDTRETKINGMNEGDFPLIPKVKKTDSFLIETTTLEQGLGKVLPAVSPSEFKPELSGVFLRMAGDTLNIVATDTFRLAEKKVPIEEKKAGSGFSLILPQKTAQEVCRIFDSLSEEMEISSGDNQVSFETKGMRVISRVIEGNFPEYTGIIPKNFDTTSFLSRAEIISAVRAASIFASKIQEVSLHFKGRTLEVTSQNPEVGEHRVSMAASTTGKENKISFNYRYLLDGLNALDEEEIFIGAGLENAPAMLRNKSDGSFVYVLMPIRLT